MTALLRAILIHILRKRNRKINVAIYTTALPLMSSWCDSKIIELDTSTEEKMENSTQELMWM
jgi:hypothetical protein